MSKPVFMLARRDANPVATQYTPLIYARMTGIYRLAMHKNGGNWLVSDPISGAKICSVTAHYKGCPVASGDLPIKHARAAALADLDALVDRIGFDRFDDGLRNPKPR